MQVTDVRIDRLINRGNYKAECSVKLDNDLLLTGIIVAKGARDYYRVFNFEGGLSNKTYFDK